MIDMLLLASGKILHLLGKFTYIFTYNKIYEYFCDSEHTATFSAHFKPFFENFRQLVLKLSFAQNMAVFHSWGPPTWLPWQQHVYRKHNFIQCHFTFQGVQKYIIFT
jgi:hypothetical protein